MANPLEDRIWEILRNVKFPGMSRDVVSFGFIREVRAEAGVAIVNMHMATQNQTAAAQVKAAVERALAEAPEIREATVNLSVETPVRPEEAAQRATMQNATQLIPGVKSVVAVASGKGGVGKSTVAANLAVMLGQMGYRVGLLDADIYGPSVPIMFGIRDKPRVDETRNRIYPFEKYGIRLMSLGFILDTDTPVIWRGPMVMKAIEQMLGDVEWGELDYLIVDLPPGTGDAQLTLTQRVPLSGAVVVTTPQDVALVDARKGLAMFRKVNVPVVGIVENMSIFVCPHCGEKTEVFKTGGGARTAELLATAFLGAVPLDPAIVIGGDAGEPIVIAQAEGPHAEAFRTIALAVIKEVEARAAERPKLVIH